jgi:hypothetical protein
MPECPGCGNSFSRIGGYSNHLQQTQKPACHAVLTQAIGELWTDSEPFDADTESSDSDAPVANHLDFKDHDYDFGNHEDEDDLMYGANDYGEAPAPEQPEEDMDIDEPKSDQDLEDDLYQAWEVRWAAEEAFRKTPIVEVFPLSKAGAPITNIQDTPGYDSYKTCLNDSDNPWDPFLSQLDWELAYWAKRCGPSATAFTALLKIEGVRISVNADRCGLYLCLYSFASV